MHSDRSASSSRDAGRTGSPASSGNERPTPGHLVQTIQQALEDGKADDIVTIDLNGKSTIGDVMFIASGRSSRQVGAIADRVLRAIKDAGYGSARVEGKTGGDWILIDAGDAIVHIFRPEVRDFYDLERMWSVDLGDAGDRDLTQLQPN